MPSGVYIRTSNIHKLDCNCMSCRNKRGQTFGQNNPNWKGGWPKCQDCNKKLKRMDAIRCLSCARKGELHPNWNNGSSFFDYPIQFNDKLKLEIRTRDNFQCQNCSMTEEEHIIVYGQVLHVHHIDYDKKNCKEINLISTCNPCNTRANFNRTYWQEFYRSKQEINK